MLKHVTLVKHASRPHTEQVAFQITEKLRAHGITVHAPEDPAAEQSELVIAVGGDGTLLWAAEEARPYQQAIIAFNTGHMGFLTEVDSEDLDRAIAALCEGEYRVENRATIDVTLQHEDGSSSEHWALNEAAIGRTGLSHPANLVVGVDGRAVSAYAADGIIISTPTGSTAYAFSAGGPIVWPDVSAMLLVPLAAHGLFTTPLILGEGSQIEVQIARSQAQNLQAWFDGRRQVELRAGDRLVSRISKDPVRLARIQTDCFAQRLVNKFQLPVSSWRGA
ncbi:hypothetical protein BSR29_03965 [Boudabousia liubingyangii]|uniref:NAD kinase n=1 Tax=Boudabousia liubingyangii TaxID=1921764 RepID=A0A1Q5PN95_9ACTO|nr:NAD(+)/NADH kinase [Boudabousia liubingyangii]OKL47575.1 hypothetical protein BSR28_03535 [Boudabousia liubingyangii]OKL48999.1 hypothetical protein BSR29_03965 [Boudabousia liubingyangii]